MRRFYWVTKSFNVAKIFKCNADMLRGEVMSDFNEIIGRLTCCDVS